MKNLLKLMDLSEKEIVEILNTADQLKSDQLKFEKKNGIPHRLLEGKVLGLIFAKSSTRTRVSFEVGMFDLGGTSLFLSSRDLQIGRGEIVQDTARVLSRYLDGIMIRTFDQREVEALAEFGTIPIINGLTDYCHPCQVLADLMTIREYKGNIKGRKLCYIGDGNNMTNSLIVGGIKLGMEVSVACPAGYEPDADIMRWAYESGRFSCSSDVLEMAQNSDVLYTDVWASMGQEGEAEERKKVFKSYQINVLYTDVWASMGQEGEAEERKKVFKSYQINDKVLSVSKSDAMVLHCLPAHREEEITSKVFEEHSREIFDEAENRLHAQKAVLVKCLL